MVHLDIDIGSAGGTANAIRRLVTESNKNGNYDVCVAEEMQPLPVLSIASWDDIKLSVLRV